MRALPIFYPCCVKSKSRRIPRVKYWKIAAHIALSTVVLAIGSTHAEPPPATIDCTFYPVKFPKGGGYSTTKVAPKEMIWLAADDPFIAPNKTSPSLVVWDKNYRQWGFTVLGRGKGHLTPSTDLRKLCIQLAKVASVHGANAINYHISGTEIRVQFLRIEEGYFRTAGRRQNLPSGALGSHR